MYSWVAGGSGLKVWLLRVPHARFVSVGLFPDCGPDRFRRVVAHPKDVFVGAAPFGV